MQLAFIASRQLFPVEVDKRLPEYEKLVAIFGNVELSNYFHRLASEVFEIGETVTTKLQCFLF